MSQTDMKASVSSSSSSPTPSAGSSSPDAIDKAANKLCQIVKRQDFDGYGFNLHSEKAKPGQFIGKVDANSPAEAAGLKEGDRILEVNGVAINTETHKQVVQRIKAISCEVRLLLVDVDGKGDGWMSNGRSMETSKTEQVLPGASENIKSITMVSTKRPSQESQRSTAQHGKNNNGIDVTDKALNANDQHQFMNNNNIIPPPPSATMAASPKKNNMNNNIGSSNSNSSSSGSGSGSHSPAATGNGSLTEMAAGGAGSSVAGGNGNGNGNATIKAGSLQLPMTAAEMRAKLMMKKKYDPKNESVDLKKKYEIVQKL